MVNVHIMRNRKGSTTVEAAMIFPIIFFIVIALIYVSIFLYEQAFLKSLADRAAEKGVNMWNSGSDMYIGLVQPKDFEEIDPYWRLIDLEKNTKEDNIETYIKEELEKYSIIKSKDSKVRNTTEIEVNANVKNYVIYKKLTVDISKKIKLPIGNKLSDFGIDNTITISVCSEAIVNEPAEFIRSTDFAIDITKRIDNATGNNVQKVMDKVNGFISNIKK